MLNSVQIIEINSNHIIAEYPIELVEDDFKEDYFAEAWKNAVDDGLVNESKRSDYFIKLVDDDPLDIDIGGSLP